MAAILVTGGAGFIGSAFVRFALAEPSVRVINLDKLTYAGHLASLDEVLNEPRHTFVKGDIRDRALVGRLLREHQPRVLVHIAAESHVDRSIDAPAAFFETNTAGALDLLTETLAWWQTLDAAGRERFRYVQVSTDEVYGSLGPNGYFTEESPFAPNSPYAASKAAADHFSRAFHRTYGLPTIVTHCSNNYGPRQYPEKLIPLMTLNALQMRPLPVYGDGQQVRDWLHVDDHCRAIWQTLEAGRPGETYNLGGDAERTNLELVQAICRIVDRLAPDPKGRQRESLLTFVADRPGHDRRYAIDSSKAERELGWRPQTPLEQGLEQTIAWYLKNDEWINKVSRNLAHQARLGLGAKD